jgi:hypothetical protein
MSTGLSRASSLSATVPRTAVNVLVMTVVGMPETWIVRPTAPCSPIAIAETMVAVQDQTGGPMGKVRVAGFGVSIDSFGAGPDQSLEHPLGKGGRELHNWFYPTRTFRSMIG